MNVVRFIGRQLTHILQGGWPALQHKLRLSLALLPRVPLLALAVPVVLLMRMARPWCLIRVHQLISARVGHFAANTELYLCERDAGLNRPASRYVDVFCLQHQVCNNQLAVMWRRTLRVWPRWAVEPVIEVNRKIPGGARHEIGNNSQSDRDVHNLWDRQPPHLSWTRAETEAGEAGLRAMGIPEGAPFVCLIVRDSAYLQQHQASYDWSYHNYRDSHISNYVAAAEALADRGVFVIRMGAAVKVPMPITRANVIDYATNGMRTDFLDIYLGAKCLFCISTGTGWDMVPGAFRRPVVYVNFLPIGHLPTFRASCLSLTKVHWHEVEQRPMTLDEIFTSGAALAVRLSDFEDQKIRLIENSPAEIREAVIEMLDRLQDRWQPQDGDDARQQLFWERFREALTASGGAYLHGELRSRVGADFLRRHASWLG